MFKAAILDDYQNVASGLANWEKLASQVKFSFFCDHLFDENEIANRLEVFDIPLVNRERAPFLKSQLEKLPNLTLEHTAKVGVILATKKELFSKADFITIHMPLSDRSRGIVGAEEIKLMKYRLDQK